MSGDTDELTDEEKRARLLQVADYLEWIRRREAKCAGHTFDLGDRVVVMFFSGSVDGAIDWLTRRIGSQGPTPRRVICRCPRCREIDEQA